MVSVGTIDPVDGVDSVDSRVLPRETTVTEPEWRRVAAEIRQRIRDRRDLHDKPGRDGLWLPAYPDMLEQHATSYGTYRSVLLVLEAERWVDRVPGVGVRVREGHPE